MKFWMWLVVLFVGSAVSQTIYHSLFSEKKKVELTFRNFKKNGKRMKNGSNLHKGRTNDNPFCEEFIILGTFAFEVVDCAVMVYVEFEGN